jgi:hypothetical protein
MEPGYTVVVVPGIGGWSSKCPGKMTSRPLHVRLLVVALTQTLVP